MPSPLRLQCRSVALRGVRFWSGNPREPFDYTCGFSSPFGRKAQQNQLGSGGSDSVNLGSNPGPPAKSHFSSKFRCPSPALASTWSQARRSDFLIAPLFDLERPMHWVRLRLKGRLTPWLRWSRLDQGRDFSGESIDDSCPIGRHPPGLNVQACRFVARGNPVRGANACASGARSRHNRDGGNRILLYRECSSRPRSLRMRFSASKRDHTEGNSICVAALWTTWRRSQFCDPRISGAHYSSEFDIACGLPHPDPLLRSAGLLGWRDGTWLAGRASCQGWNRDDGAGGLSNSKRDWRQRAVHGVPICALTLPPASRGHALRSQ